MSSTDLDLEKIYRPDFHEKVQSFIVENLKVEFYSIKPEIEDRWEDAQQKLQQATEPSQILNARKRCNLEWRNYKNKISITISFVKINAYLNNATKPQRSALKIYQATSPLTINPRYTARAFDALEIYGVSELVHELVNEEDFTVQGGEREQLLWLCGDLLARARYIAAQFPDPNQAPGDRRMTMASVTTIDDDNATVMEFSTSCKDHCNELLQETQSILDTILELKVGELGYVQRDHYDTVDLLGRRVEALEKTVRPLPRSLTAAGTWEAQGGR